VYRAALAAGGPNADLSFALAELFYRLGDLSAARERYFTAIELDENFVEARVNLGCLLAEQGRLEMAVAAFEGALRYHEDYADAHYHLAKTFFELGRRDEALPHWEAFLRLAPDSPWAAEVRLLVALAEGDKTQHA
jgi:tetratricopeptide (TPR) repeat protein